MRWLAGLIILVIILIIAASADFLLGRYFHEKKSRRCSYPVRNGRLQLITSGPDLFSNYFDDLYKAKRNIHVLFYIVKNDRFSKLFFDILIEQARKGTTVRLLLDWFGSRKVSKKLIRKARCAGVEVEFCHRPRFPFTFFALQQRNHRKVTIIDGEVGYVGGFNVGKEYIDLDPVLSPWRDYHLRIEGEGIADLQREFLLDWEQATGSNHLKDSSLFPNLEKGPMLYRFFPTQGVDAEDEILKLINQADQSIFIGTPYFIPPEKLVSGLEQAINRGVAVTILVPNKSDHPLVKEASFHYLHRILAAGGEGFEYEAGFFHAKVILIDGKICDIGTANFDYRSFKLNYEINCFIYDQDFINEAERTVVEDIGKSSRISMKELDNPTFFTRLKKWTGMMFKHFL